MAFDVYTDDGVLHRNVPAIEMPANAGKTAYKKFVAENDIPSVPGEVETEEKTVTPTESVQTVNPSTGKLLSKVTVQRIPTQYVIPSGTKEITSNGSNIDVSQYKYVHVNVQATGAPTMVAEYTGSPVEIGTDVSTLSEFVNVYITFSDGTEISLGDDDIGPFDISGEIAVAGSNQLTVSFGGMTAPITIEGIGQTPVYAKGSYTQSSSRTLGPVSNFKYYTDINAQTEVSDASAFVPKKIYTIIDTSEDSDWSTNNKICELQCHYDDVKSKWTIDSVKTGLKMTSLSNCTIEENASIDVSYNPGTKTLTLGPVSGVKMNSSEIYNFGVTKAVDAGTANTTYIVKMYANV